MTSLAALVVGATGKQGGAVVKALLADKNATAWKILALTRDTSTPRAQTLAAKNPGRVEVVQGDVLKPNDIFAGRPPKSVNAAYLLTTMGNEEGQAIPFIDAAVKHGVKHIVFSSVDRGGDERSWTNPTEVKHFYEKQHIEVYLRDKAQKAAGTPGAFTWTILRPVFFMDNLNPGTFGSLSASMWAVALRKDRKLQLIATSDIGVWAARSIVASATPNNPYANRAIGLAGDELTLTEAQAVFRRVMKKEMPKSSGILGRLLLWFAGDVGKMFKFFDVEGYGADIAALKKEQPDIKDFATWLTTESGFAKN